MCLTISCLWSCLDKLSFNLTDYTIKMVEQIKSENRHFYLFREFNKNLLIVNKKKGNTLKISENYIETKNTVNHTF